MKFATFFVVTSFTHQKPVKVKFDVDAIKYVVQSREIQVGKSIVHFSGGAKEAVIEPIGEVALQMTNQLPAVWMNGTSHLKASERLVHVNLLQVREICQGEGQTTLTFHDGSNIHLENQDAVLAALDAL